MYIVYYILPNCFPEWLDQTALPPAMHESSCPSTSSPTLGIIHLFNFCHSDGQKILSYLNSSDYKWIWTFLHTFFLYSCELPFLSFVYFKFAYIRGNFYYNLLNSFSNLKNGYKVHLEGRLLSIKYQITSVLGSVPFGPDFYNLTVVAWFGHSHRFRSSTQIMFSSECHIPLEGRMQTKTIVLIVTRGSSDWRELAWRSLKENTNAVFK